MGNLPWIVFVVGSAPIIFISRRSLLKPAHHGFWRFFVFELCFALVCRGLPTWFADPFIARQLVSWPLLALSILLAVLPPLHFKKYGGNRAGPAEDEANYHFENTGRVVSSGIFAYIRHPMYTSLICLAWGAALKVVDAASIALAVVATSLAVVTALVEEVEDLRNFGPEYATYMKKSRRFIPFVF